MQKIFAQVAAPIEAQFELFDNKNGLSQGFVSSIIQDKTGFIWFATKDGLNKFDGYHITVYRYNPEVPYSLPDNSISTLCEDSSGNFWVGTRNKGLFLFDRMHEHFYPIQRDPTDNLVNNPITAIVVHGEKMLVADYHDICLYDISPIKSEQGFKIIPTGIKKLFSFNDLQNPGQHKSDSRLLPKVEWMPDQSIWKAMSDTVFICKPDPSFSTWQIERRPMAMFGMNHERVFDVFHGLEKNQLILVGSATLVVYDWSQQSIIFKQKLNDKREPQLDYFTKDPFEIEPGKVMYFDVDGYHMFDQRSFKTNTYINRDSISKIGFNGLIHFKDRDGILWIGSGGYGIYKYNNRQESFHTYPIDASGFIEDENHNMYFNFRTGAAVLNIIDKTQQPILPCKLLRADWENPLVYCRSKDGVVWLKVESKSQHQYLLLKYNSLTQQIEDHTDILYKDPEGQLLNMFTDSKNNLWQLCYDADRSRKFMVADANTNKIKEVYSLPLEKDVNKVSSFLNSTLEDANGNFWFSTNLGLFKFNPSNGNWNRYINHPKDSLSLSGDIIFSVCPDPISPQKYIWVGTNGRGLNRMDLKTGQCKRYGEKEGLPNNVIYGILNDANGNLWLSTNQGLSCFNIASQIFRNYTKEDGLPGNEFNRGQFYKSSTGQLFFGGVDGITWFNPNEVLSHLLKPNKIVFTGFSIYNQPVDFKSPQSVLTQPIQYTNSITLPAEQNMFTIEFALLQFSSDEKKHYKYFLEGFDKTWIDNGTKNSATFTNLDPGTYHFHVLGCNSDGIWSSSSADLTIIVKAPWYKTWWFQFLALFLLGSSMFAFYRYRLHQSLKLITMRNLIASDLHDEIGSTISSISLYSDILEERVQDTELKQLASRISESSRDILIVMSDIVWSINPKNDRFDHVVLRMQSFAHEMLDAQQKKLIFDVDERLNSINLQMNRRKNFYLIFKEAFNNVVKYADASLVRIELSLDKTDLVFVIEDDGKGFNLDDYKEGNGILNMKRRALDLDGKILIQSQPGNGTKIELVFPIAK